ncbi:MAG: hypothetical protein JST85_28685 [Acidobacteria bacterium]|nr:hypothetical protein [Acidobacteriota bacterium]
MHVKRLFHKTFQAISLLALSAVVYLSAQAQTGGANHPNDLYGGIEVGSKGIKATAIRAKEIDEGHSVKLIYAEVINTTLMQLKDNQFAPDAIRDTALAVTKLLAKMRDELKVPDAHISIVGSSGLKAENPQDLVKAVRDRTGKQMSFLDVDSEVQLSIVGTIPQRYRSRDGVWKDNRGISVLMDIGSGNTKGGYQLLRQLPTGTPDYDYVTVGIPKGTVSFTNEINQAVGDMGDQTDFIKKAKELAPIAIRTSLRKEMERKPGLVNRPRVYLSGGIVWAMATLLHPDDRRALVPITSEDIDAFYRKVTSDPDTLQKFLNPDLSKRITNGQLRAEAETELETVRNTFSPRNLIAGAEILKAVSSEFQLHQKRIRFARYSYLAWILSYTRLQVGSYTP